MWKLYLFPETIPTRRRRLVYVRPIFWMSLALMAGIWVSHYWAPPFFSVLAFAFLTLCFSFFQVRKTLFFLFGFFLFFWAGILFGINGRTVLKSDIALAALEGPVVLQGKVISTPEEAINGKKETLSFVLSVDNFFRLGRTFKSQGKVQVFLHNAGRDIHFGDELRLRGRLELPKQARNPHVFDYAAYLSKKGIHKIFRGIGRFSVLRQKQSRNVEILPLANRLRIFLKERIETLFPDPHQELANALLFGFRKNIPREIRDAFIKTGTAHLLAISGLHVSLIGGLFYFSLNFLGIGRPLNLMLTAFFIVGYAVLAGANPPVLRASIMGVVVLSGFLLERERHIKSALFLAFFLLLIADPKLLFLASFQLSFVAVASLIFILPIWEGWWFSGRREKRMSHFIHQNLGMRFGRFLIQTFATSFAATVGMFPLLIWYFNQFSLTSFLANAVAIPVCTFGIAAALGVLLIDLIGLPMAQWLVFVPVALFDFELKIVTWFSEIPFGYFYLPKPTWIFFALYYGFLIAWLVLSHRAALSPDRAEDCAVLESVGFKGRAVLPRLRFMCLIGLVLAVAFFLMGSRPETSRFLFFDLGKADAAFVSFSNGARFLVNTGRHFPSDQSYWILKPYLMASGIENLDGLLVTKTDAAHAGGFKTLVHHVGVRNVWIPFGSDEKKRDRYINPGFSKRVTVTSLSEGDRIEAGSDREVYIQILAAHAGKIGAFLISDRDRKMLYISSAEERVFKALLSHTSLKYDVVFLPHHESGIFESEKMFLKGLSTRYLVFNQRDRLPEIRSEISSYWDGTVLLISELGAIEFSFRGEEITHQTFLSSQTDQLLVAV